ncbi:Neutral protease 2 [Colletotrichum higginsianum IMI 349063]|uniref:Neutral protease 2 n=1 Tax=Colletotrichum higginsianum (strain IMI 349063) TaxID=759273 RepID=A0A1B7YRS3_COLHI|nr:Neutral protease 2 [Colletotrichum higginsianum IMI 349063]OBR14749.1 Neutral protease 2 [Colletotrichum higginsianum IMI 349063]
MLWSSLINLAALTVAEAHLNVHNSPLEVRDATLQVTLEPVLSDRVAEVSATIKNSGSSDLNLLKVGTILDDKLPVQRVLIADDLGNHVPFRGIEPSIRYDALKPSHFQLLPAGESLNITIDPAKVHLFEKSGTYSVTAQGLIPAALAPLTDFSHPAIAFKSNTVSIEVDADAAASRLVTAALVERTNLQPGCNETTLDASTKSLSNCQALALAAAADAADPASKRFVEYFRTNSSEARDVVVARFRSVAEECGTTDTGVSRYFCYDYYGICEIEGPLNAYTLWQFNTVVMCPLFYGLPPLPVGCHRQCQATTTIHEITHCEGVYAPHTNDYAYAYDASVALPLERALLNADNYSLYANGTCRRMPKKLDVARMKN